MIRNGRLRFTQFAAAVLFAAGCGPAGDKTEEQTAPSDASRKKSSVSIDSSNKTPRKRRPIVEAPGKTRSAVPTEVTTKSKTVAQAKTRKKKTPQTVFRPSDNRPRHDAEKLAKVGIRRYESKRLILYTDIDPKIAKRLPVYIDRAYNAWVDYFGELPPTRERTEFQVTGYIMADEDLFKRAGLIPENLREFHTGRHRGYEFWMYDQKWDYFRRHTMIHEATHCFMYAVRDVRFLAWYMEGMAEYFGTHWTDSRGTTHFGIMPAHKRDFAGFGRVELVQNDVKAGKAKSVAGVMKIRPADFIRNDAYAWSWAFCKFLNTHPRYRKRFREMGRTLTSLRFQYELGRFLKAESARLPVEWALFTRGLDYGYDIERSRIEFVEGQSLATGTSAKLMNLATNRGWQSSRIRVEKGRIYHITASGRFIVAEKPKPWVSEPQGVSFLYIGGRPLGMVVAMIVPDAIAGRALNRTAPAVISVGRGVELKASQSGTLYFRVNDDWSQLENNTGNLKVRIEAAAK